MNKIILYYSDSCIHCKNMKPTWEKFKNVIDKYNIHIAVEEYEDKDINPDEIYISGYPTIKIEKSEDNIYEFTKPITLDNLLNEFDLNDDEGMINYYKDKCRKYKNKYNNIKSHE